MQFLQPILLFTLAGIAIPVIIHLFNIKQGKTLKIGSISLLTQGSRLRSRSFKIVELLLLFLRCLLLTLLALLISQPVWKQHLNATKEKGWILLEKESLREGYENNKSQIDSLLKAGYEFHYFNTSFEKDKLEEALKFQKDTTISEPVPYWSLLTRLNEEVPSSLPVYLYTANRLNRFTGRRPQISINLQWLTYIPSDPASSWPETAFLTPSDSVHVLTGHSKPTGTFYTHSTLSLDQFSNSEYNIDVINGKLSVSLADRAKEKNANNKSNIEVDTSTIRITVFANKFYSDANYIRAAIEAIRRFSKRRFQLQMINNYRSIPANQDWIFWLSERSIPAFANAKNIFIYEKGKPENIISWLKTDDISSSVQQPVTLSKTITQNASNNVSQKLWQDGFGNALLNKEEKNNTKIFHFYSRFDPDWNDLPWSDEFPKLMFRLIFPNEMFPAFSKYDKRRIDEKQMQPSTGENVDTVKGKFTKTTELSYIFWLAAFVIFFIERLLTFKMAKNA